MQPLAPLGLSRWASGAGLGPLESLLVSVGGKEGLRRVCMLAMVLLLTRALGLLNLGTEKKPEEESRQVCGGPAAAGEVRTDAELPWLGAGASWFLAWAEGRVLRGRRRGISGGPPAPLGVWGARGAQFSAFAPGASEMSAEFFPSLLYLVCNLCQLCVVIFGP